MVETKIIQDNKIWIGLPNNIGAKILIKIMISGKIEPLGGKNSTKPKLNSFVKKKCK